MASKQAAKGKTADKAASENMLISLYRRCVSYFSLYRLCVILVVLAIGVSGYLAYNEITDSSVACVDSGSFSCDAVHASAYSKMLGIPIAYLGFLADVFLLGVLLLEKRVPFLQENGAALVFGIVLFAFLYSMYLVYLQASVIHAYCQWCLTHEVILTVLFIVCGLRMRKILMAG